MMTTRIPETQSVGGKPMTAYEYIARNAANLPPQQLVAFADKFGDNMMRYFGIDEQRIAAARKAARAQ